MILENIIVSDESMQSEDEYEVVYSNIEILDELFANYVEPEEVCIDALKSYYVDYYLEQVNNGGFSQFVYNSGWDQLMVQLIAEGLSDIGAKEHLKLFKDSVAIVSRMSESQLEKYLSGGYFENHLQVDVLNKFSDEFYKLQESEDLLNLNGKWVKSQPGLEVLSEEKIELEIKRLAEKVPDKEQRIQEALDSLPRFAKIIHTLCATYGYELSHITAGDPTHEYEGKTLLAWHFITDKGNHYMLDLNGEALMFNEDKKELIFKMPAGEEYGLD